MRRPALLLIAALAALAAGCGVGAGEEAGGPAADVRLTVTQDFGAEQLGRVDVDSVPAGETVMRLLQRRFDVQTRYGGGFVQAIEGLEGGTREGRQVDWFYYVNGIEAGEGAASYPLSDGDRVWWDHRDWGTAMSVPAVVGSFPQPFTSGIRGERLPVRVDCAAGTVDRVCDEVVRRLREAGVKGVGKSSVGASSGVEILRLVVAPWSEARKDAVAALLEQGPKRSGVFARPSKDGARIDLLDERGQVVRTLGAGAGLVAATRFSDQQPTWFITGTDAAGVASAAAALEESVLEGRFAVAVEEGRSIELPVQPLEP